ncbi:MULTISPECIES: aldo/keto reductase [Paenibacillus]|uniref:Aldo/keto reductase n=1 Tax=Paenibacillus campinasensis TaxID=66347 RepID=A0A268F215_9BACL|nr:MULTISPECIES: aldo/keto reductase [Paenibacillus]MUG65831.1 aldo/keto reductase [Paenibacillus campinasensis]PAD79426.1 aldo/keto reductase [Paenibacillus campinasensis]PAK51632.1 aldo/keto reductase [Paenibacillus sp. 7541]
MERRAYGNTDMQVSILGFGGAEIGNKDLPTVEKLLHSALDAGLNVIDTAECYGNSEELIGKALAGRRSEYYLFTKCGHASGLDYPDWDPVLLEKTIDRSLQRLQVDYVDIIHLHSCSEEILRQGEVIEVLKKAKEQGKTRYIGYSGDTKDALYAVQTGVFDSLETSVNIADQEAIDLTIPEALQRGMGVIAKRPIANVAWQHDTLSEQDYAYPYWLRLGELNYDFLTDVQQGVETALRFTLSTLGVATAIVGTANPGRWQQNAELLAKGPLPQEVYEAIRHRWKEVAGADWVGKV